MVGEGGRGRGDGSVVVCQTDLICQTSTKDSSFVLVSSEMEEGHNFEFLAGGIRKSHHSDERGGDRPPHNDVIPHFPVRYREGIFRAACQQLAGQLAFILLWKLEYFCHHGL